jgi:hypothetical protein
VSKDASTWEWEKQGRYIRWHDVVGTDQWDIDKHWYVLFGFLWLRGRSPLSVGTMKIYDMVSAYPAAMYGKFGKS